VVGRLDEELRRFGGREVAVHFPHVRRAVCQRRFAFRQGLTLVPRLSDHSLVVYLYTRATPGLTLVTRSRGTVDFPSLVWFQDKLAQVKVGRKRECNPAFGPQHGAQRPQPLAALAPVLQGLTLVPNSAQLELFCPPYNPT